MKVDRTVKDRVHVSSDDERQVAVATKEGFRNWYIQLYADGKLVGGVGTYSEGMAVVLAKKFVN